MVEDLTPKEKIEVLMLAKEQQLDISNVDYAVKYVHPEYFFDYIIRIDNQYYNFCKVTDFNKSRYDNLLAINEHLKTSKVFVCSDAQYITHKDQLWFYEHAPSFTERYDDLDFYDLHLLIKSIELLNDEVEGIKLDDDGLPFSKSIYKTEIERCYGNSNIDYSTMVFSDIEKTLELRRIKKTESGFCFSGLQSFLAYPRMQAMMVAIMLNPMFTKTFTEMKNTMKDTPTYFPELDIERLLEKWQE